MKVVQFSPIFGSCFTHAICVVLAGSHTADFTEYMHRGTFNSADVSGCKSDQRERKNVFPEKAPAPWRSRDPR